MPKDVLLVFPTIDSKNHWMTKRLLSKGGWKVDEFSTVVCDAADGPLAKLNTGMYKSAVLFGEASIQAVLQRSDIKRWFSRETVVQTNNAAVPVIGCFEPRLLLPYVVKREQATGGDVTHRGMRHPPRYQGAAVRVIKQAIGLAERGPTPPVIRQYLEDPTPNAFTAWVDEFEKWAAKNPITFLSWDIETPYKISEDDEEDFEEESRKMEKTILRISFSYRPGVAVSVPWLPEHMANIQRLLAYTGFHTGHNALAFDIPVVEANGVKVAGTMVDGMDAWHLFQPDLDKGLEHVSAFYTTIAPWKHLSDSMPALYSCIDADAALQNILGIKRDLEAVGLWERMLKETRVSTVLNIAGKNGNHTDEGFRQELKQELEAELYKMLVEAQNLVADKFKRVKLYVRLPKNAIEGDWTSVDVSKPVMVCDSCGKLRASVKHKCEVNADGWQKTTKLQTTQHWYKSNPLAEADTLEKLLKALGASGFNPCSAHQMKLYMKAHRHPVGQNYKTKKDTADVKHIKKLVKKYDKSHPIYRHTLKIRQIQKALSTYVNGLEPDADGKVHTTYVNSTKTWRLGARNINVQNLGKRNTNPYAKKARKIIVPGPGKVFVQADSSSIEAKMVGWFMGDEDYMRLASKGVHGYLVAKYLGWDVTPVTWTTEMNEQIKAQHKADYDKFKQVNHGTNFGMGPYMMYMNEPDTFPTVKAAEEVQNFIFEQLPKLPEWHHQLRVTAKKNGYLDNPWGVRFYFYDVFTYAYDDDYRLILDDNGRPKVKLGKDANLVIAAKPQSSAGMFMRDNLWLLGETTWLDAMPAVVSIHDGYTLEVDDNPYAIEQAAETLENILTRPIEEMGGMRVGCEIGVMRENFLDEETYKIVEV